MLFRVVFGFLLGLRLAIASPTSSEHGGQVGSWERGMTVRDHPTKRENDIDVDSDPLEEDFFPSDQPFFEYESDLDNSFTRRSRIFKRATGRVIHQTVSQMLTNELAFCSQPQGTEIWDVTSFAFQDYAGSGITAYVFDSGINLQSSQFRGYGPPGVRLGTFEWLYPKQTDALRAKYSKADLTPQDDSDGHGSCVASLIAGRAVGVAKGANVKMVPQINMNDDDVMLAGLEAIVDDIQSQRESHPDGFFPVVLLAYGMGTISFRDKAKKLSPYRSVLKKMVDLDAIIVIPAVNLESPGKYHPDEYPELFADEEAFKNNILPVGAVDIDGTRWDRGSESPLIKVSAPAGHKAAGGIVCAAGSGTGLIRTTGTSLAAGYIAGVAAYLLSVDPTLRTPGSAALKVINRIVKLSYPREPGFPNAVWNGEMGRVEVC